MLQYIGRRYMARTVVMNRYVSPAAQFYIRSFGIEAGAITGSGPKGIIMKGDVTRYIQEKNLKLGQNIKKKDGIAKKKTQDIPAKAVSGDPDDPTTQIIIDKPVDSDKIKIADKILESKQDIPHTYMASKCYAEKLVNLIKDSETSLDEMMLRIWAKSLEKAGTGAESIVNVKDDNTIEAIPVDPVAPYEYAGPQYGKTPRDMYLYTNPSMSDFVVLGKSQETIKSTFNVMPKSSIASISYSEPEKEVGIGFSETYDTMDASISYPYSKYLKEAELQTSNTFTISISFDLTKVEMHTAGEIMKHMKNIIEDPDLLHL